MISPAMQAVARASVADVLNTLPEGLLIALLAWLLARFADHRNAGTRFAVWFLALFAVVALPFLGGLHALFVVAPDLSADHPARLTFPSFWAVILFIGWLVLAGIALLRIVAGVWQVTTIRSRFTEIDCAQFDPCLRDALQPFTNRPTRIAVSNDITVPAAFGFRKPVIVLPAWILREYSAEQIRPILLHELAHLHRRDGWTNLVQKTLRAFFFFHPAVWWIDARLALEREMACDEAVLAATGNPRAYAACLIDLLEKNCARRGWTMAQAAVRRATETTARIRRILATGRPVSTRIWKPALAIAGCASVLCCAILLYLPRLVAFGPNVPNAQSPSITLVTDVLPKNVALTSQPPAILPAVFPLRTSGLVGTRPGAHPAAARRRSSRRTAVLALAGRPRAVAQRRMLTGDARTVIGFSSPVQTLVVYTAATAVYAYSPIPTPDVSIERVRIGEGQNGQPQAIEFEGIVTSGQQIQFWRFLLVAPQPEERNPIPVQKSI